jgi:hypothetical protein
MIFLAMKLCLINQEPERSRTQSNKKHHWSIKKGKNADIKKRRIQHGAIYETPSN